MVHSLLLAIFRLDEVSDSVIVDSCYLERAIVATLELVGQRVSRAVSFFLDQIAGFERCELRMPRLPGILRVQGDDGTADSIVLVLEEKLRWRFLQLGVTGSVVRDQSAS